MDARLVITVCGNYLPEAEAVRAAEGWSDVAVVPESKRCAMMGLTAPADAISRHQKGETVVEAITCARRRNGKATPLEDSADCLAAVAPSALVKMYTSRGAYVATSGWVSCWREKLASWGFDRDTARAFFQESVSGIVMLDTGAWPGAQERLVELSTHLGVKTEAVPVGLDCMRHMLSSHVARWRLKQALRQAQSAERTAARRLADQALAVELLRQLAEMMTEAEAVESLRELCALLFGAHDVRFLPLEAPTDPDAEPLSGSVCRLLEAGFSLQLAHHGRPLGRLEVGQIAMIDRRDEYMALAGSIAPLCGLALANARALTRIRATEQALRAAKDAAEAASRTKSAFLASMSHEIRTPLNAVIGYAQLLRRDESLGADQRKNAEIITRSGEHLLSVINSVLEMSKIEAGRTTLNLQEWDLKGILADVEALFRMPARDKGLQLLVSAGAGLPEAARFDAGKVKQVLINLVGNALKFTDRGRVSVLAGAERQEPGPWRFVLRVSDTGIGVPSGELESIFDAFEQTQAGRARAGTGLGLTICRQYARLMGGDVTAASVPGEGSSFFFEFLAEYVATATNSQAPDAVVRRLAPESGQPRVLVVDDRDTNRGFLATLLQDAGFVVYQAADGAEAVDAFERETPDLVIMDIVMPVLDGCEATRRIRQSPAGRRVPVLMVSASALDDHARLASECGADGFLRKPLRDREVFEEIGRLLRVEYAYVSDQDPQGPIAMDGAAVDRLSPELRKALFDAAELGYTDTMMERIGEVAETEPALGRALKAFADAYDYSAILKALAR